LVAGGTDTVAKTEILKRKLPQELLNGPNGEWQKGEILNKK